MRNLREDFYEGTLAVCWLLGLLLCLGVYADVVVDVDVDVDVRHPWEDVSLLIDDAPATGEDLVGSVSRRPPGEKSELISICDLAVYSVLGKWWSSQRPNFQSV